MPFISRKSQEVQMQFAEDHLQKGLELWKTVLFADANKYNAFGSDGCNYV